MSIENLKKIVKQIKNRFLENKKVIEECIKEELKNGYMVSFESLIEEIEKVEKDLLNSKLDKLSENVAVIYNGNPETTINIIISSIYFENKIYLYAEEYSLILTVISKLIEKTLEEFKITDKISLHQEINADELAENEKEYDKIIFIGDYFEYEKIQSFISKEIIYDSFGFIKVYINKNKYTNEYKELMKNSYKSNINIEYYSELEEFIENVNDKDTVIIYEEKEILDDILKKINPKKVLKHSSFMESYRFSYI